MSCGLRAHNRIPEFMPSQIVPPRAASLLEQFRAAKRHSSRSLKPHEKGNEQNQRLGWRMDRFC
jgi:hypothetical protein